MEEVLKSISYAVSLMFVAISTLRTSVRLLRPSSTQLLLRNHMGIFAFKGFSAMRTKVETDPGKIEGTDLRIVKYPDPIVSDSYIFPIARCRTYLL